MRTSSETSETLPFGTPSAVLLALLAALASGCTGGRNDDDDLSVRTTALPSSASRPPAMGQSWFVYFADEFLAGPSGTDLNGDSDVTDAVAVALKMGSRTEQVIGVAALGAAVVGSDVWLVVDEAEDGQDWNGSMTDDVVLLHWREALGVAFVDTLDDASVAPWLFRADDRVYYASADPLGTGDETNLRFLVRDDPTVPVPIASDPGNGPVRGILIGEEEELLVVVQDETAGGDLNGDGDGSDTTVLGLLDGERSASTLRNTGLAVASADVPWGARREADEWLVGVLVDEAAQGQNLNDPALFSFPLLPDSCATADSDMSDQVLFFLDFPDFDLPGGIGDTGIAGRSRVVVVEDHVATLADEADSAGCDLNEDGDTADQVVRWAEATASGGVVTVEPPRESRQLHAAATTVPGGSSGLARLRERLVELVDEAADGRDLDGKAQDHVLVAWLDPGDPAMDEWTFEHQGSNPTHGTAIFDSDGMSEPYAGAGWMADDEREGRLPIAFQEKVPGTNPLVGSLNNNLDCRLVLKDTDLVDELPVWMDFESGPTLDFDGVGYALDPANGGVVVVEGHAYFRVSEAEDDVDYTKDGDKGDLVLVRNPLFSCGPEVVEVMAAVSGPAILVDDDFPNGAAFLSTGIDFDGDGTASELVVRHFRF